MDGFIIAINIASLYGFNWPLYHCLMLTMTYVLVYVHNKGPYETE